MLYSSTFPLEGCRKLDIALKIENTIDVKILQGVALLFIYVEKNPSTYREALAVAEVKSSGRRPVPNEVALETVTCYQRFQLYHILTKNVFEFSVVTQEEDAITALCTYAYL